MSEDNKQQFPSGILISGICMGFKSETQNGFTNNDIVIKTGETVNDAGETVSRTERVSCYGDNLPQLMQSAERLKGKHVVIQVFRNPAKRELREAFMRNSISRSSQLLSVG
jgi:hypothetical protein